MSKHIKLIGIELEGGWADLNFEQSLGFKHDGSVSIDRKKYHKIHHIGEIESPPLALNSLLKWTDRNYPTYTNRSCGGHIHLSFNTINDYSKLTNRKFLYYLLSELKKWGIENNLNKKGVFWQRIEGKNTYCKKAFRPDDQIQEKDFTRYTIVNACFQKHGTLEIRVLPCFQKKYLMLSAVKFLYEIIENYLEKEKNSSWEINRSIPLKEIKKCV